jgi:uncharacterized protein (UPF0335 family)
MPKKTTTTADHAAIGHNSGGAIDPAKLMSFVERVESIELEIASLTEDRKSLYAEAAFSGIDAKALKGVIKLRRLNEEKHEELAHRMAIVAEYTRALGGLADLPLGRAAMARDGVVPPV